MRRMKPWFGFIALTLLLGVSQTARAESNAGDAFLGVFTSDIDAPMLEALNYDGYGILVEEVVANSPADKAGITSGDILVKVNDRNLITPKSLHRALWRFDPGDKVTIVVWRDGKEKSKKVELGEREKETKSFFWNDNEIEVNIPEIADDIDNIVCSVISESGGYMGVRVESLSDQLAEYFGAKDGGVLVKAVIEDSPAEKAGLKAGDVITKLGDVAIEEHSDLTEKLRKHEEGDKLDVIVLRDRKEKKLVITLGKHEGSKNIRIFTEKVMKPFFDSNIRYNVQVDDDEVKVLKKEIRELKKRVKKLE